MEQFADDNIKFDENGRRFSRKLQNTVGKGEIAFLCRETFPNQRILDSSRTKEFTDGNSKFDKNDTDFSIRIENTGKRRYCSL